MTKRSQLIHIFLFFACTTFAEVVVVIDSSEIQFKLDSALRLSKKGKFLECIDYLEQPIEQLKEEPLSEQITSLLGEAYLLKADATRRLDDFDIANTLYGESERILLNCQTETCRGNLFKAYNGQGIINRRRKRFEKAVSCYEKALETQRALKKSNPIWQAIILNNIANCQDDLGNSESTFSNYKQAIEIVEQKGTHSYMLSGFNSNLAESYYKVHDYDKAIHHFKTAISIFEKNNKKRELANLANAHQGIGSCFFAKDRKASGFDEYQTALGLLDFKVLDKGFFDQVLFPSTAIQILIQYADEHLKLFESTQDVDYLQKGKEFYELAVDFLFHLKSGYREEISKEILIRDNYGAFEGAIESNYLLYELEKDDQYLKQALDFAEKSQNAFLMESVVRGKAVAFAGIPDSILQKESAIKGKISNLESELNTLNKSNTLNKEEINRIRKSIFQEKENYYAVLETYEKYYPEYFDLKYSTKTVSYDFIKDVLLPSETSLLEFFIGEKSIFVFLLSKGNFEVFKVEKTADFDSWVKTFQKSTSNYDPLDESGQNLAFVDAGYLLYESLIKPIEAQLSERIIIIPSGELSYLPFDALLTELPEKANYGNFKSHKYFGSKHQLSYSYSATLLKEWNRPNKTKAKKTIGVFAPTYTEDYTVRLGSRKEALKDLGYNKEEAQSIASSCGGDLFSGEDATISNFQEKAADYGILHFAMHSFANDKMDEYSFLAFSKDEKQKNYLLYLKDLFNQELNADMVVLSSCRSGIGELKAGEGIVSLARGFSYAGAKSIVTTLWQINDKYAALLMSNFYKNLSAGMTKDEALQNAKKDFIKSQKERNVHPYFWAGFIPIGNMNAIEIEQQGGILGFGYKYLLGFLLICALLGLIVWKK